MYLINEEQAIITNVYLGYHNQKMIRIEEVICLSVFELD